MDVAGEVVGSFSLKEGCATGLVLLDSGSSCFSGEEGIFEGDLGRFQGGVGGGKRNRGIVFGCT